MLSEEEIKKAKKSIMKRLYREAYYDTGVWIRQLDVETLLQYIQELETSNAELDHENNRLERIEFERDIANKMVDEMAKEIKYLHDYLVDEYGSFETGFSTQISTPKGKKTYKGQESTIKIIKKYFKEKVDELYDKDN